MRRYGVCAVRACGRRGVGSQGEATSTQSPAELLRKAQARRQDGTGSRTSTTRHARKTAFYATNARSDTTSDASHGVKAGERSAFMRRLASVQAKNEATVQLRVSEVAEARRQRTERKVREERSRMLVFRDVGMDLDKPILSRDVLLVAKYMLYGTEFAVDNELERMLRYFNEHATDELKIIQDSKLMRGPSSLSRKRSTVASSKAAAASSDARQTRAPPFPVSSAFPEVRAANVRQFCAAFAPDACRTLQGMLQQTREQQGGTSLGRFFSAAQSGKPARYSMRDASLFTTLHPGTFRRPAAIIYSQLGQQFGTLADLEWRSLLYRSICPALLPYLPKGNSTSARQQQGGEARVMPIDVISLRSMDMYRYDWVQRIYVGQLAKMLNAGVSGTQQGEEKAASDAMSDVCSALVASTTFVGTRLLQPFYEPFGLRNYLLPHVMLLDHEGTVRWLSAGYPDAYEAAHMPALLAQLEREYAQRRS